MPTSSHTVVIGGGISGLAAAHSLRQAGNEVTVLEATNRVGGRMVLVEHGGDAAEGGAQGIHTNYTQTLKLIDEFGLRPDLMAQRNHAMGILDRSGNLRVARNTAGMLSLLGVRGTFDFVRFVLRYITFGKQFDVFETGENIPEYDRQSMKDGLDWGGKNFYDFVVRPYADAMANTTPEYTNLFHALNLIKTIAYTEVSTLRAGNKSLPERIASTLPVERDSPVSQILTRAGRVEGVLLGNGKVIKCDHVVVSCPIGAAAKITPGEWTEINDFLRSFKSAPFVLVYFFLDRPLPSDTYIQLGHGFRDTMFNMALHHTEKTPHLVKSGKAVISAWSSYPNSDKWISRSDTDIVRRATRDLEPFYPNLGQLIEHVHVQRHPWGIARLSPGDHGRIIDFKRRVQSIPGLYFAISDLDGVHMESGIRAGLRAARQILGNS